MDLSNKSSTQRDDDDELDYDENWFEEDASDSFEVEASKLKVKLHINPKVLQQVAEPDARAVSEAVGEASQSSVGASGVAASMMPPKKREIYIESEENEDETEMGSQDLQPDQGIKVKLERDVTSHKSAGVNSPVPVSQNLRVSSRKVDLIRFDDSRISTTESDVASNQSVNDRGRVKLPIEEKQDENCMSTEEITQDVDEIVDKSFAKLIRRIALNSLLSVKTDQEADSKEIKDLKCKYPKMNCGRRVDDVLKVMFADVTNSLNKEISSLKCYDAPESNRNRERGSERVAYSKDRHEKSRRKDSKVEMPRDVKSSNTRYIRVDRGDVSKDERVRDMEEKGKNLTEFLGINSSQEMQDAVDRVLEEDRQNAEAELEKEIREMEEVLARKRLAYKNRKQKENEKRGLGSEEKKDRMEKADPFQNSGPAGNKRGDSIKRQKDPSQSRFVTFEDPFLDNCGRQHDSFDHGRDKVNQSYGGMDNQDLDLILALQDDVYDTGECALDLSCKTRDRRDTESFDTEEKDNIGELSRMESDLILNANMGVDLSDMQIDAGKGLLDKYRSPFDECVGPMGYPEFPSDISDEEILCENLIKTGSDVEKWDEYADDLLEEDILMLNAEEPSVWEPMLTVPSRFLRKACDDLNKDYDGLLGIMSRINAGFNKELDEIVEAECDRKVKHLGALSLQTQLESQFTESATVKRVHLETVKNWMKSRPLELLILGKSVETPEYLPAIPRYPYIDRMLKKLGAKFSRECEEIYEGLVDMSYVSRDIGLLAADIFEDVLQSMDVIEQDIVLECNTTTTCSKVKKHKKLKTKKSKHAKKEKSRSDRHSEKRAEKIFDDDDEVENVERELNESSSTVLNQSVECSQVSSSSAVAEKEQKKIPSLLSDSLLALYYEKMNHKKAVGQKALLSFQVDDDNATDVEVSRDSVKRSARRSRELDNCEDGRERESRRKRKISCDDDEWYGRRRKERESDHHRFEVVEVDDMALRKIRRISSRKNENIDEKKVVKKEKGQSCNLDEIVQILFERCDNPVDIVSDPILTRSLSSMQLLEGSYQKALLLALSDEYTGGSTEQKGKRLVSNASDCNSATNKTLNDCIASCNKGLLEYLRDNCSFDESSLLAESADRKSSSKRENRKHLDKLLCKERKNEISDCESKSEETVWLGLLGFSGDNISEKSVTSEPSYQSLHPQSMSRQSASPSLTVTDKSMKEAIAENNLALDAEFESISCNSVDYSNQANEDVDVVEILSEPPNTSKDSSLKSDLKTEKQENLPPLVKPSRKPNLVNPLKSEEEGASDKLNPTKASIAKPLVMAQSPKFMQTFRQNQLAKRKLLREGNAAGAFENSSKVVTAKPSGNNVAISSSVFTGDSKSKVTQVSTSTVVDAGKAASMEKIDNVKKPDMSGGGEPMATIVPSSDPVQIIGGDEDGQNMAKGESVAETQPGEDDMIIEECEETTSNIVLSTDSDLSQSGSLDSIQLPAHPPLPPPSTIPLPGEASAPPLPPSMLPMMRPPPLPPILFSANRSEQATMQPSSETMYPSNQPSQDMMYQNQPENMYPQNQPENMYQQENMYPPNHQESMYPPHEMMYPNQPPQEMWGHDNYGHGANMNLMPMYDENCGPYSGGPPHKKILLPTPVRNRLPPPPRRNYSLDGGPGNFMPPDNFDHNSGPMNNPYPGNMNISPASGRGMRPLMSPSAGRGNNFSDSPDVSESPTARKIPSLLSIVTYAPNKGPIRGSSSDTNAPNSGSNQTRGSNQTSGGLNISCDDESQDGTSNQASGSIKALSDGTKVSSDNTGLMTGDQASASTNSGTDDADTPSEAVNVSSIDTKENNSDASSDGLSQDDASMQASAGDSAQATGTTQAATGGANTLKHAVSRLKAILTHVTPGTQANPRRASKTETGTDESISSETNSSTSSSTSTGTSDDISTSTSSSITTNTCSDISTSTSTSRSSETGRSTSSNTSNDTNTTSDISKSTSTSTSTTKPNETSRNIANIARTITSNTINTNTSSDISSSTSSSTDIIKATVIVKADTSSDMKLNVADRVTERVMKVKQEKMSIDPSTADSTSRIEPVGVGEGSLPGTQIKSRLFFMDSNMCCSVEVKTFLGSTGLRLFDPHNLSAVREIRNIESLVLIPQSQLSSVQLIPNLLKLKRDLRVKFLVYGSLADIKTRNMRLIFPRGGLTVFDDSSLYNSSPDVLNSLCEFMCDQQKAKGKPWKLLITDKIIPLLNELKEGAILDVAERRRLTAVCEVLTRHMEGGVVEVLSRSEDGGGQLDRTDERMVRPRTTQEYLSCCLSQQRRHLYTYRHFLFISDMPKNCSDMSMFVGRGIDVMNIPMFMRCFVAKPNAQHFCIKNIRCQTTVTPLLYSDAGESSAVQSAWK